MGNQTVYPYGQGGQLPSGYPIADDLNTNSAQQALSARQGVVINDALINPLTELDLSAMPSSNGVLVSGGAWSSGTTGHKSVSIPVLPGQKYRIVPNASQGCYYAFFASVSLYVKNGTPNYSSITSGRQYIAANTTSDIVIPSDTYYLYVTITNAGTAQAPQHLYLMETKDEKEQSATDGLREEILGKTTELCDYATDSFVYDNDPTNLRVTKVGEKGYLIFNSAKTSGKYYLYTLPSGLEDGKTYQLSFDYKSNLSANWTFAVVGYGPSYGSSVAKGIIIPSSGSGHISFDYVYTNGDYYLRLASYSQNAGSSVVIENLSITANSLPVVDVVKRMSRIDNSPVFRGANYFAYSGKKISVIDPEYIFSDYGDFTGEHQSSACYGDYLVTFTDQMTTIRLYNLAKMTLLATVTQTALDSRHHCNQSFFGTEFYDANDDFPLVYITVNNNGTVDGGYMEAYRIVPTMGETDYESFTITLVQTVTLPIMSESNALGNANFVLDSQSGYLYTYSRNNTSSESNYGKLRITKWNMPKLSQGNVVFTDADILDSWETGTQAANSQGAAIKNNLLFIFRGYVAVGYIYLLVIDLLNKENVALIDIKKDGFTMEPEGVFFWGNTLCTSNTSIIRFFFR